MLDDLKFALRQMTKAPALFLVAVVTLGLGIGSCALVFSWIRSVLVDTTPGARDPGRLVVLAERRLSGSVGHTLSLLDGRDLATQAGDVFEGVIGSQMEPTSLRVGTEAEWVWAQVTTANFFDVLGAPPALGRGFSPGEDQAPGGNPVVVISHKLWERRFGKDPNVLGRTVEIARRPFVIIGVAREGFRGTMGGLAFDLWMPVTMSNEMPDVGRALESRGWRWLHTMARLRDGVSVEQAQAAATAVMRRAEAEYPNTNRNMGVAVLPMWKSPWGAQEKFLPLLSALAAVAVLLLGLVIANVANLLLARSTARSGEMAVRLALGARGARLARLTLVESLVLAALGGALGCVLAAVFRRALLWMLPPTYLPIALDFPIDGAVLAFTAGLSIVTGLLFGSVPAWAASQANVAEALKAGGRSGDGPRQSHRMRQILVVTEIGAALVLLVSMALCARSFQASRQVDVGLDARQVWIAGFRLPQGAYSPDEAKQFYRRLREGIAALPGVRSVGLSDWLPLGFEGGSSTSFEAPGYLPAPGENIEASVSTISPGYMETLRIPILAGRDFDERDDADAPPVVIINEHLAQTYFPGRDPIGLSMKVWGESRRIIGVVKTGKYRSLAEPPEPYIYFPADQVGDHTLTAVIRTDGPMGSVGAAVERLAVSLDPIGRPVAAMPMTEYMAAAYLLPRVAATLLAALGGVALLLAGLGVYAVIAWSVGRRTREVGVRMALGAGRRDVVLMFLAQGARLSAAGLVLGVLGSVLVGRVMGNLLVDVSSLDPVSYLTAAPGLALVVGLASWLPARRAARTDPIAALRVE